MHLQAPHCPSCGAPLDVPEGDTRVTCEYCGRQLVVHDTRVTAPRIPAAPEPAAEEAPFPEPDATSYSRESPRFELSVIEQLVGDERREIFSPVDLTEDRFALVSLRAVDADGASVAADLSAGADALRESLEADGDPGLAANVALEALCTKGFPHRLECAALLFDPKHATVLGYAAGFGQGLVWVSSEEGSSVTLEQSHPPLERKMLREARDYFSNFGPKHLAAHDLVVMASAGFTGRGKGWHGSEERVLFEALNANLGEEPLRVVTLAKNAFWQVRRDERRASEPPMGDVRLAAVRVIPPPVAKELGREVAVQTFRTKRFELAALAGPGDALKFIPLHGERHVLVWLSTGKPVPDAQVETACNAVTALLDRRDYGDNENPQQAGRDAYAALGATPDQVRMAVIQLFEGTGAVRFFRGGWDKPVSLGARGAHGDEMQQFDEGGHVWPKNGSRVFFPGALRTDPRNGENTGALAEAWSGGKASRLYSALVDHWKTKKTDKALEKLALAARSDVPDQPVAGMALVTGQ